MALATSSQATWPGDAPPREAHDPEGMTAATGRWPCDGGGNGQPRPDVDRQGHPAPARPAPGTSLRDALLTIGGLLAALVLVELAVPSTSPVSAASILDGIAVAAFTVTGLVAWHRRPTTTPAGYCWLPRSRSGRRA